MDQKTLIERTLRLADHTAVSIIVAVQFLASLFFLLSTPFFFNYGGAAAHPEYFLLWIAYWSVGVIKPSQRRTIMVSPMHSIA